jgi:hypothetical protein
VSKKTNKHQKSRANATSFEQAMVHVAMAQLGQNAQRVLLLGGRHRKGLRCIFVAELEILEDLWSSVISLVLVMVQILLNNLAIWHVSEHFLMFVYFSRPTSQAFGFGTQAT